MLKGVCPCEYMDSGQRFNEKLPDKKEIYTNLTISQILTANMQKESGITQQSSKSIEMCNLDPAYFLLAQRLA